LIFDISNHSVGSVQWFDIWPDDGSVNRNMSPNL